MTNFGTLGTSSAMASRVRVRRSPRNQIDARFFGLMDDGARRWMIATARKNRWRMPDWYDFDDMLQDGQMAYYHVRRLYPHVTDAPHVMRLFQLTYLSRITDRANWRTRQLDRPIEVRDGIDISYQEAFERVAGAAGAISLARANVSFVDSDVVDDALRALDARAEQLRMRYRRRRDGTRESLNDRLCRWVGVDPRTPLVAMVREYLMSAV